MKINGQCHCGEISFSADVVPDQAIICHCSDCQVLSGSPYRAVIPALESDFHIESGKEKIYVKTAEDGSKRAQAFCPKCGTPIYSAPIGKAASNFIGIRIGAVNEKTQLIPSKQIWCRSALNWVDNISGIETLETQ